MSKKTSSLLRLGAALAISVAGCSPSRPTEPRTVVFYGDSLTAGTGVSPAEAYPSIVQQIVNEKKWPVTVVNAGVSGDTSSDGLARLPSFLDSHPKVDVFVLALGANDVLRRQSFAELEDNLNKILDRVKERNPQAKLVVAGIDFGLVLGMFVPRHLDDLFERVADRHGAELVPSLLGGVVGNPERNTADGIHPNAEGHRRVARAVWGPVEKALGSD